jgi:hypothetical protein
MAIVHIAMEADDRAMIENRTFEEDIIRGPAVLAPLTGTTLEGITFDEPPEHVLLELPKNTVQVGFIGLRNVTFRDCRFQIIGIAGDPDLIRQFGVQSNG